MQSVDMQKISERKDNDDKRCNLFYQIYGPSNEYKVNGYRNILDKNQTGNNVLSNAEEELAELVATSGDQLEDIARNFYGNKDRDMSFLFHKEGVIYHNYRERVKILRKNIFRKRELARRQITHVSKQSVLDMACVEQYAWQPITEWKMKKVIDKRTSEAGTAEYLVSWEELDNTWEPADIKSATCQKLILDYEYDYQKRMQRRFLSKKSMLKTKKNTAFPIISQHQVNEEIIIGAAKLNGELNYLVKLQGSLETYFISSLIARSKFPDKVIKYLETRIEW